MIESVQAYSSDESNPVAMDIAPLIDVVFILLIFFLVTTSFITETGIKVNKPVAVRSSVLEARSLRICITSSGTIFIDGKKTSLAECQRKVETFVAKENRASVVIVPDEDVTAKRLVEVMDAAKLGGATEISIATRDAGHD